MQLSAKKEKVGSRNIWLLGSSSLFNDVGSEMVVPILPFFINSLGGGGIAIGAVSGLREGLASIFKLLGGWLSDRTGKRMPFVFIGYFVSALFKLLLAISNSWQQIIAFASIERLGKARDAPRDAIITVSTKKHGRGFAIHQMLDTVGGILGAIMALLLFWKLNLGFKSIIFVASLISAFSLIPLIFVREPKVKSEKKGLFKGIRLISNELKYFIIVASAFTLANFGLYLFLLLVAQKATGSIVIAISLGVLFNIVWAVFAVPFGNLSDKIGRKRVLLLGYILFFFVSLGFIYSPSLLYLAFLFILYGLVYALTHSTQRAYVADLSGKMKGTSIGFYQFVTGFVNIAGGIIAGVFWNISPSAMFIYISAVAFVSIILLLFVNENKNRMNK